MHGRANSTKCLCGDAHRRYSPIFPLTSILTIGFFLFFGYGLSRKSLQKASLAAFESVWEVKTIIALFAVVGAMSAAWRAAGTIPEIVSIFCFAYFSIYLYSGNISYSAP